MKTKTILNMTAFVFVVSGIMLKATYLPGGSILIILSAAIMIATLFIFGIKDNKESGLTNGLNYFLTGTLSLLILGTIFKIQHWMGWPILASVSYALAFFLPVIFLIKKSEIKISKQFFITLFTFFILVLGIIPNNPISKYIGRGWDFPMTGEETTVKSSQNPSR